MCHNRLDFNQELVYKLASVETFLKKIILQAGDICMESQNKLSDADVSFKSRKDLVTVADKKVEDFIIGKIKESYPDHSVLGEETGLADTGSDYMWIIDPIDGTTSFFHHQPFYAISIALNYKGGSILAAVYAPALGQLFFSDENDAFLNNKKIRISQTSQLNDAVMATGFACLRAENPVNNLPYFNRLVPQLRDIRRYGSAAIDLCYVACGKLDGFWEMDLNIYDIAAGVMIVKKAGGTVCDFAGHEKYPQNGIIAANTRLIPKILDNFTQISHTAGQGVKADKK